MNNTNPLQKYFRQPALYTRLPTSNRWYSKKDISTTNEGEIAVYGLTALDEVMLNTPDAMLNGQSLEKVIKNCVPDVKNVKKLTIPDLEAIFVAIKAATNNGMLEINRSCPKCKHENVFDTNCQHFLDTMTFVEDNDTIVNFDDLIIHVKPYDLEMRQIFLQKEFEEERTIKLLSDSNEDMNEFEKAKILADGVERLSRITFSLVAKSIEKIDMVKDEISVTDPNHITEWLTSIGRAQADAVIKAVNALNEIGINRNINITCEECGHSWDEKLSFDPISFFGRR